MMECLTTWWGFIDSILTYDGLTPLVLSVTLVYIIKYTLEAGRSAKETRRLAETTVAALQVEKDSFELRQRPVVSIITEHPGRFYFIPRTENRSLVHALVRVKATVVIDGTQLTYPKDSPYGGSESWQLQSGAIIFGNMKFDNFMRELETDNSKAKQKPAQVTFETWSVNFHSDHSQLDDDNSKGPIVQFYWSPDDHSWIPEVSPILPQ